MPFMIKWPKLAVKNKKTNEIEKTKVFKLGSVEDYKPNALPAITLKVIKGASTDIGCEFSLGTSGGFIGRKSGCWLHLHDPNISRYHAFLGWEKRRSYIEDRGSTNGTYVNGQLIQKKYLRKGDHILIGDTELVVEVEP